jgi:geranylgeranyl pyrophosphate synthase
MCPSPSSRSSPKSSRCSTRRACSSTTSRTTRTSVEALLVYPPRAHLEDDPTDGSAVAHKIYGVPQTINTGNYVYFLAYQELFSLTRSCPPSAPDAATARIVRPEDLEKVVTAELLNLHRGQGLDLLWRDTLTCPTEEAYVSMVNNKTGGLFRLAVKLLMACATTHADVDYIPLVNLVGVYFQIRDDYLNLESTDYEANKGFAEDLTEGKFSFPIVHAIRSDTTNRQVLSAYFPPHGPVRARTDDASQTSCRSARRRRR